MQKKKPGRPPLGRPRMLRITFCLLPEEVERIDNIIAQTINGNRSTWIRQIVRDRLEKSAPE